MLHQALDTGFKVTLNGSPLQEAYYADLEETAIELDGTRPDMAVLRFRDTRWSAGSPTSDLISVLRVELSHALEIKDARTDKTVFKGEITSLEYEHTHAGRRAIVRAYDKSHRLHRGRKTRIFKNQRDSGVFRTVLEGTGIEAGKVQATGVLHDHLPQMNQTDWEFLHWRAEENGFALATDDDGKLCFCPPVNKAGPELAAQKDLFAFRPRLTAPLVSQVEVSTWDAKNSKTLVSTQQVGDTKTATLSDGPSALSNKFGNTKKGELVARPGLQQAEIDQIAKTLAERHAQTFAEAEGVAQGNPDLRPGVLVTVKGVGSKFDGKYRISSARHVLNHAGYRTHMVFSGLNDRSALALSSDGSSASPQLPRLHGLVTGIVTQTPKRTANPSPPDDSHVKVKFDWLKDKDGQPYETDWIKTVQIGAGNAFGGLFLPEVGDEVLVGFEHGDMRRPYVIGGVYNNTNQADTNLTDTVVDGGGKIQRRGFTSRTKHKLAFDDANTKADGITLVTGDDNLTIVLDKKNTKITIDSKNGKIEIHGQQDISIKNDKGDISLEAGAGNISLKAMQNVKIEAQQDLSMSAQMNAKVAANINLDLTSQANAKLANATGGVTLAPGVTNLKGPLINIGP